MRIDNTLLIIGAGAHVPYGMPTSYELKRNIKFLLNSEGSYVYPNFSIDKSEIDKQYDHIRSLIELIFRDEINNNLEDDIFFKKNLNPSQQKQRRNILDKGLHRFDSNSASKELLVSVIKSVNKDLVEFLYMFENSQSSSIDNFLSVDHSNEILTYEIIGRVIIYYLITYYENYTYSSLGKRSRISLNARNDDWIEAFISKNLDNERWKNFFENPPGIITFNYDCILEKKIGKFLEIQKKLGKDDVIENMKKLNVVHVYGSINSMFSSPIVELKKERKQAYNFRVANVKDEISAISITDRKKDIQIQGVDFEKYQTGLFLGYGFDVTNNGILRRSFDNKIKTFYTTNYGLSPENKAAFKTFYNQDVFGDEETDTAKLLKNKKLI